MNAEETGRRIAALRKEKGLTQKELAEALHVTDKAVSKWERGLNFPEILLIEPLAQVLGTTAAYLLELEEASAEETIGTMAELSGLENNRILRALTVRCWMKITIELVLVGALIGASRILADNGIFGLGQVLTSGMVSFVGFLIGSELYTLKNLKKV